MVAQLAEGLGKRLSALKEELLASEPGATAAAQAVETAQKDLGGVVGFGEVWGGEVEGC